MVQRRDVVSAIVASLTDELLRPKYRRVTDRNKFFGHCYVATEAYYHLVGGASSGFVPQRITHEGGTHWYLKHRVTGKIVDLTAGQFRTAVPYENGVGCGFLTRLPSKRAVIVIQRVAIILSAPKAASRKKQPISISASLSATY